MLLLAANGLPRARSFSAARRRPQRAQAHHGKALHAHHPRAHTQIMYAASHTHTDYVRSPGPPGRGRRGRRAAAPALRDASAGSRRRAPCIQPGVRPTLGQQSVSLSRPGPAGGSQGRVRPAAAAEAAGEGRDLRGAAGPRGQAGDATHWGRGRRQRSSAPAGDVGAAGQREL